MTQAPHTDTTARALLERYGAAWAAHDVDAIMAMHGDETSFQIHDGSPRAEGRDAVRAAFEALFAAFPDLRTEEVRTVLEGALIATEYRATLTREDASSPVTVEVVDVIELREGLVHRKDTYLDTAALAAG